MPADTVREIAHDRTKKQAGFMPDEPPPAFGVESTGISSEPGLDGRTLLQVTNGCTITLDMVDGLPYD